ncbi:putative isoprenylcysteine alpha-carbonyl methylesterase ICMEL2 [Podospora fimiseda]|uniref:Isoprenylcysteine alpha-carbonyl methylesterase ICMEL2 n=1 Tax=Podospora fimiseda TaxID=252190 RepID=A0AAN7BMG5_9PEZI|nr:putative isoprenylcysteine alpha-carbonyl methylesterase ICMEL2 [Podospora fimiseda]
MVHESNLPPAAPPGFTNHSFCSKAGIELNVRVWPANPTVVVGDGPAAPFVIWTHGGGWFGGFHFAPLKWMPAGFISRGYHLVSHNYRLAPQARVDDQLSDCLEAVAWCRANLPLVLGKKKVDVDRYVLVGESAGGHLVTLMGLHLNNPPPRAIVDLYGLVDFLALPAFSSYDPNHKPISKWDGSSEYTDAELDAFLSDRNPQNTLTDALSWNEQELLTEEQLSKRWATDFKYTKRIKLQAELHIRRTLTVSYEGLRRGVMHREKFGTEEEFIAFVKSMSPLMVLREQLERGIKRNYPPTALLHGSGDEAVAIEQSYAMAKVLKELGVPIVESYEKGEPHVFDKKYTNPNVPGWETYIQPVLDFVDHHVGHGHNV